jgi:tripartite-type tricarboxylate transporter receptor subunit TctC
MIKKIVSLLLCLLVFHLAQAKESITIEFGAAASQPNAAPYIKMLELANRSQNKYEFILEFKPGAQGVLALRAMDQSPLNRLATVAPSFVENARQGLINESDYVPVVAQGDACWAVITNVGSTRQGVASLQGQKEITVGGTGYGNATHLTALIIGEKLGFRVRYIVYKANYEALTQMAAGEPINFVLERVANYQTFKTKNPRLQILGINCSVRNPAMPEVKTLAEQGYTTPTIFMATVSNIKMPVEKRQEIARILDQAQMKLGTEYLSSSADLSPPMFRKPKMSTEEFFNLRVLQIKALVHRYEKQILETQ